MAHEHKAVTVQGVIKVLQLMGSLDAVAERVSPQTQRALDAPQSHRFHPGAVLDETLAAVADLMGLHAVEQIMYRATEGSLQGVAGPLARVFMTVSGEGPVALLKRFETLISAGAQGFRSNWEAAGPHEGTLVISTDAATPFVADHSWKGTVEYLLRFADVSGTVTILPRGDEGRAVQLHVAWV